MTDSFELDKRTPRKGGTCALRVKIYRSRTEQVLIGLKIYLHPTQWDGKKIVNSVTAAIDNARLNKLRVAIGRVLFDIDDVGENPPMAEVRRRIEEAMGARKPKPTTFCAFAEKYSENIKNRKTREALTTTLRKVRNFDSVDRPFSDITIAWLRGFEQFCIGGGMMTNAISVYLRNIRTIYNRAIDDGVAQLNDYPFRRFRIKQEKTRHRALSLEQLRALRDIPCTPAQVHYRDLFMLIFYLRGINIADLMKLTEITDGRIEYRRAKTGTWYKVKIEPEALEIIERYRGARHLLSAADKCRNHENFTKRINTALRTIGAPPAPKSHPSKPGPAPRSTDGMYPELTTYWARHSWATIAAGLDIPKETIAAGLGHVDNSVTAIYIDFDNRKVDAANRRVIDALNGE